MCEPVGIGSGHQDKAQDILHSLQRNFCWFWFITVITTVMEVYKTGQILSKSHDSVPSHCWNKNRQMGLKFYVVLALVGFASAVKRSSDSKSLNSPSPNLAYTSSTPYSAPSHQGYSNGYHSHSASESRNNRGYHDDDRRQYYDSKSPSYNSKEYDSPAPVPQAKVNSPSVKSGGTISYAGHHAVPLSFASLSPGSNSFYAPPLQGSVLLAYPQPTLYSAASHGTQFAYVAQPSSHDGHIAVAPAPSLIHSPTLSHFTYASPLSIAHLPKAISLNTAAPTLHTHH